MLDDQHVLITSESGTIEEIVHVDEAGDDIQVFQEYFVPVLSTVIATWN
jgi:hypothetical protein